MITMMTKMNTLLRRCMQCAAIGWFSMLLPAMAGDQSAAATSGHTHSPAELAALSAAKPYQADFNFKQFTGDQPFTLNTLPTTIYGPPWADIVVNGGKIISKITGNSAGNNFLSCSGASIALCYYSGPTVNTPCPKNSKGVPTCTPPCTIGKDGKLANCTCYAIPETDKHNKAISYLVDINAILNQDVYLETVKVCGHNGSKCKRFVASSGKITKGATAPVCAAINANKLIPGADMVSAFSMHMAARLPVTASACGKGAYAGCMTAPCKKSTPAQIDPSTGMELVQCSCPTWTGDYQIGNAVNPATCDLPEGSIWSAANTVNRGPSSHGSASASSK